MKSRWKACKWPRHREWLQVRTLQQKQAHACRRALCCPLRMQFLTSKKSPGWFFWTAVDTMLLLIMIDWGKGQRGCQFQGGRKMPNGSKGWVRLWDWSPSQYAALVCVKCKNYPELLYASIWEVFPTSPYMGQMDMTGGMQSPFLYEWCIVENHSHVTTSPVHSVYTMAKYYPGKHAARPGS